MQEFHNGDWVRVAKDLGPSMSHFTSDCEAIVLGSYADQFGGDEIDEFTLFIKGEGEVSWYYGNQLTLIESGRMDKLREWEKEVEDERKQKSDLDWIFNNGPHVADHPHGASIQALANCIGLTDLWGRNGEGITYYSNAMMVLRLASPYLMEGNKDGWVSFCESLKADLTDNG